MRRGAAVGVAVAMAGGAAQPASAAEVALSFADAPGGTASGFRIERREAGSERFAPIALVGPGVSEFVDRGLPNGATYCYRVRALGSVDPADWSPEVCAPAGDPGAPTPESGAPATEAAAPAEATPPEGSESAAPAPPAEAPPVQSDAPSAASPAPSGVRIRTTGGWLQVLD